jgi:signal transduction histidine kinase/ligand-binding sensor domain-containing protein
MRRFSQLLYACAWLLCSTFPASSQVSIQFWTTDNGLPQNIIRGICQTPDGYLWLATFDGLVRFDGVRFTTFNRSNTPEIKGNRFGSLLCTADGDLWVATEWSGVTRRRQGRFTTYTTANGLPSNEVHNVIGDKEGHIWALSGASIVCWDEAGSRFVAQCSQHGESSLPTSNWLGSLDRGTGSDSGFWSLAGDRLRLFFPGRLLDYPLPRNWPAQSVIDAGGDLNGDIWLGGVGGRLAKLIAGRWSEPVSRLSDYRDSHGNVWNAGMASEPSGRLLRYVSLSSNRQQRKIVFNAFFEDREGSIWLATDGQGLCRLRKEAISVLSQEDGLPDRNIYPIYQDRAGSIWIGTWNRGLACVTNGKIKTFSTSEGLVSNRITAISEDRDGVLWVASDPGLHKMQNGRFQPVRSEFLRGVEVVRAIHQDPEGTLWFGTSQGLIQNKNGTWSLIGVKDGLAADDVRVIIDGRAGNLWIGGYGGLTSLDHGRFRHWTQADGLPSNSIRSLYEDSEGILWIGTYDGGLGRLQGGRFTRYSVQDGLFNDGVFQILEDSQSYLWMSSNRGIFRVAKRELTEFATGARRSVNSVAYTRSQGLRNEECNGGHWPAGIRARNGELWFPTQDGAAVIDPSRVEVNPHGPPVAIESILVDREPNGPDRAIRIQPGQENLEIQFTALSLINSERIQFKYQLVGLDRSWVDASSRRTAYYSHLPPREYDFRVIAANSDGVWNMQGAGLHISVLPPFYRAWWFLTLISLAVLAVLLVTWQYRVSHLKRAFAAQEAFSRQLIGSQEAERQRIAGELHDSLGQQLLIIKNWAMMALSSVAGHEALKEPLSEISTTASQSIDEVRGIAYNLRPYLLEKLGLTIAIQDLVKRVAASSGIPFTAEVASMDGSFSKEVEISIYRIVQEALNNTVRHSHATQASVRAAHKLELTELIIEDNGCGFTPAGARTAEQGRHGFGLRGIAERVRMLGGELKIQSAPGSGCVIHISLRRRESDK